MEPITLTPNEPNKVSTLKLGKDQFHALAESFLQAAYMSAGKAMHPPTPDTIEGREKHLDKIAHDQFIAFCQKFNPMFSSDAYCESKAVAKAHGRDQRIYADLFGLGDSYRVRGAVDKLANMDPEILINQAWERRKQDNPKIKREEVKAALEIAGLV